MQQNFFGVLDQTSTNGLANESRQVGSNVVHTLVEVSLETLAVLSQLDYAFSEVDNGEHVDLRDVSSHRGLSSSKDLFGALLVAEESLQGVQKLVGRVLAALQQVNNASVQDVVIQDLDELGEVPRVPLTNTHGECVDVLVQLVQQGDALNDHVIGLVDVELNLGTRVRVSETTLGCDEVGDFDVLTSEGLEESGEVHANATQELEGGGSSLNTDKRKCVNTRKMK